MPDDQKTRQALAELLGTPEGRRRIAESMAQPRRCGGLDYDPDGTPIYAHERRAREERRARGES